MSESVLTRHHDPARLCLRCGDDFIDPMTHRCLLAPKDGEVLHLTNSSDYDEHSSFCTGEHESPSTWHPEAATCLACLDAAADDAADLLARVQSRRAVLRSGGSR